MYIRFVDQQILNDHEGIIDFKTNKGFHIFKIPLTEENKKELLSMKDENRIFTLDGHDEFSLEIELDDTYTSKELIALLYKLDQIEKNKELLKDYKDSKDIDDIVASIESNISEINALSIHFDNIDIKNEYLKTIYNVKNTFKEIDGNLKNITDSKNKLDDIEMMSQFVDIKDKPTVDLEKYQLMKNKVIEYNHTLKKEFNVFCFHLKTNANKILDVLNENGNLEPKKNTFLLKEATFSIKLQIENFKLAVEKSKYKLFSSLKNIDYSVIKECKKYVETQFVQTVLNLTDFGYNHHDVKEAIDKVDCQSSEWEIKVLTCEKTIEQIRDKIKVLSLENEQGIDELIETTKKGPQQEQNNSKKINKNVLPVK